MVVLASLLAGLFGGAGWSAAWELWLRPRRDRRSIARALTAEIEGNVAMASSLLFSWSDRRDAVPAILRFSTLVFTSLSSNLGDVDVEILQDLVWLYRDFAYLNDFSAVSAEIEMRDAGSSNYGQRIQNRQQLALDFKNALEEMLVASVRVQEGLSRRATAKGVAPRKPMGLSIIEDEKAGRE